MTRFRVALVGFGAAALLAGGVASAGEAPSSVKVEAIGGSVDSDNGPTLTDGEVIGQGRETAPGVCDMDVTLRTTFVGDRADGAAPIRDGIRIDDRCRLIYVEHPPPRDKEAEPPESVPAKETPG